jgi:hypothetical protein
MLHEKDKRNPVKYTPQTMAEFFSVSTHYLGQPPFHFGDHLQSINIVITGIIQSCLN